MDTLSRLMRDASELAQDPPGQGGRGPVEDVWRRGRRRRVMRRAAAGAGALVVLAVLGTLALGGSLRADAVLPADRADGGGRLTEFPQRIGHQAWVRDLPATPGPMAAVLERTDGTFDQWEVVSPGGRRHALPLADGDCCDTYPVLSADGRRLAYLQPDLNRLVVQDLVTGVTRFINRVGAPAVTGPEGATSREPRAHQWASQSPGWFSPSGQRLALSTLEGPLVVDLTGDGEELVPDMHQAAGWLDDFRLVGRTWTPPPGGVLPETGETEVEIVVWDRRTRTTSVLGRIDLSSAVVPVVTRGQWWGSVRSDGTLWISLDEVDSELSLLGGVRLPDLAPVRMSGRVPPASMEWVEVELAHAEVLWRGTEPLALDDMAPRALRPAVLNGPSLRQPVVVLENGADVQPVAWAAQALSGDPALSLVGTSTAWWAWWWQEVVLAAAVLGALLWWRRRRRTVVAE